MSTQIATVSGFGPAATKLMLVSLVALTLFGCRSREEAGYARGGLGAGRLLPAPSDHCLPAACDVEHPRGGRRAWPVSESGGASLGLSCSVSQQRQRQQQTRDRCAERLAQRKRRDASGWEHARDDQGVRLLRQHGFNGALRRRPRSERADPVGLSALCGGGSSVRALADQSGLRPPQSALSELRLRPAAQSGRTDRQSGRPSRVRARRRLPMPSGARS